MKKVEKKMLKTKLSLALSTALLGVGLMGHAQAAPSLGEDGLGDAVLFPYYSAQGGWQTFIRLINTSDDALAVKVRFREQANSRDVLDFMVVLSPHDMWGAWTGSKAGIDNQGNGVPGIRTRDTSCIVPGPNGSPLSGESFVTVGAKTPNNTLVAAAFKDRAFTGVYNDGGNNFFDSTAARLSEGHIEVIAVARYQAASSIGRFATHNADTGKPFSCSSVVEAFKSGFPDAVGINGKPIGPFGPLDAPNALAANAYMINVNNGQGAGYNPTMIRNFKMGDDAGAVLATEAIAAQVPGSGRKPDLNSADAGLVDASIVRGPELAQYQPYSPDVAPAGVDVISTLLMRSSIINEWAAKKSSGVFSNKYTQWIVNFPTKNFYVDLQNDANVLDDVSPTLTDPTVGDDAVAPFINEFDYANAATGNEEGRSCQPYQMDIYNTEEGIASFTSPAPSYDVDLCQETNVISFHADFNSQGLAPAAPPVVIPSVAFPIIPAYVDLLDAANTRATEGWARLDLAGPGNVRAYNGLPVNGWMMTIYDKGVSANNYTTIHEHKYERGRAWIRANGRGDYNQKIGHGPLPPIKGGEQL